MGTTLASALAALAMSAGAAAQTPSPATLRIVVIEGEDAVNIIQQKTAVAPVVEVRDRNNLPVPGVAVTFTVGGQGATFGGASSLTVVTNAAGQATAAGLTPTAAGALQIQATATFQGQTAVATISQSNVMTAVQAAAVGAGAGGGISGVTIGLIAAAAAGGGAAVAASRGGNSTSTPSTPAANTTTASAPTGPTTGPTPAPAPQPTNFAFSGDVEGLLTGPGSLWVDGRNVVNCTAQYREAARVTLMLVAQPSGEVSGNLSFVGSTSDRSGDTCSSMPEPEFPVSFSGSVTGTTSSLRFTHSYRQTGNQFGAAGLPFTISGSVSFGGGIEGAAVNGTLIHNLAIEKSGSNWHSSGTLTVTIPVTLR